MNHFLFILKTVLISIFVSGLFGTLSGFLWSIKSPDHAHQIYPNWLITLIFSAIVALAVGIIVGSFLTFLGKANLTKSLLYTNGIVFFIVIALIAYSIHNA